MKILLAAVNAKYIHSNLAVYCLKSYAASKGYSVEIAEYTINQQPGEVLCDLYGKNADVVAFSCYIWNIEFINTIIKDYKKVCPQCELWLGGPEVSYRAEQVLEELPQVRGIIVGEGEETFAKLVALYEQTESDERSGAEKGFCDDGIRAIFRELSFGQKTGKSSVQTLRCRWIFPDFHFRTETEARRWNHTLRMGNCVGM